MTYNFDEKLDRLNSDSAKWRYLDPDVIPMWVADMDFRSPEPIIKALHERVEHGVFGYGYWLATDLPEVLCQRLKRLYDWDVSPDEIVLMPGVVSGFNSVIRAFGKPDGEVLMQPPVYFPFLAAPANHSQHCTMAELTLTRRGEELYYEIDFDAFEAAITPETNLFLLCSPHNPVGRSFTKAELTQMAEICARHDLLICSDEIHCDLLMDGTKHTPLAAISPEISQRTVTLMAPSKTFNIPGLGFSFAVIQNPEMRERLAQATAGIVPHVRLMGTVAAYAAYTECDDWLAALNQYLTANRDFVTKYVNECLPGVRTTVPEATYLSWLDCREAGIEGSPTDFFREKAKVGLSDGPHFGQGGEGFVRFNYGCPREQLQEALDRMQAALRAI